MTNGDAYTKEAFARMGSDERDYLIYGKIMDMQNVCDVHADRISRLENRKKFDTGVGGIAGLVGGFLASMFSRIFG